MAIDEKITQEVIDLQERLDQLKELVAGNEFSFDPNFAVPAASNFEKISQTSVLGTTFITFAWVSPTDPNVERFEIYAKNQTTATEPPKLIASYEVGPAIVPITVSEDRAVIFYLVTVMKNGLHTNFDQSPTVSVLVEAPRLDRFEIQDPVGTASSLDISTAGTTSTTPLNYSGGGGRLISVGVAVFTPAGGGETGQSDVWIDITTDGGSTKSIQIMDNDIRFHNSVMPWMAVKNDGAAPGLTAEDALMFPLNITFNSSMVVSLRKTRTTAWVGTAVLVPVVLYGILT